MLVNLLKLAASLLEQDMMGDQSAIKHQSPVSMHKLMPYELLHMEMERNKINVRSVLLSHRAECQQKIFKKNEQMV